MTLLFLCLEAVKVSLHTVCAVLLHLLRYMPVNVKRECGCGMSDVRLYGLDIIAILK